MLITRPVGSLLLPWQPRPRWLTLRGMLWGDITKRALLAHEGVEASRRGRVIRPRVFYSPPQS